MKKSFLKTFIVLVFASICFFNNSNIARAEEFSWQGTATKVLQYSSLAGAGLGVANWLTDGVAGETVRGALIGVLTSTVQTMAVFSIKLAGWILSLAGGIFDGVMYQTVTSANLFNKIKGAVDISWKLIRDIGNIVIVFSLLYLGIRTILNGNGFAETKTLAGVLAAAVLINFSLLFTQVAFTTSNFVSKSIIEQIKFKGNQDITISGNIARMVGTKDVVDKIWNASGSSAGLDTALADLQSGVIAGMTSLVIAIILFVAALMILYRFLIFVFLMVTSPVGLTSSFIPWLKGAGTVWWSQLKQQFIFLPVFAITLYVALLFIGVITQSITPATQFVEFFFYFLITCGFLLGVLIIPSKVAGGGATMMTNLGNWGTEKIKALPKRSAQLAGQAAASGTARTGRYLGGNLLANKILNNKKLGELKTSTGLSGSVARSLLRRGEGLKGKTFDIRNTKYGKTLGIGEGITSWNAAVEAKKEKLDKRKKQEEKLFGFDKMADTLENRADISVMEAARDAQGAKVKEEAEVLRQVSISVAANAAANGNVMSVADTQRLQTAQREHDLQKEELVKREKIVGELKNKGDSEYMKLVIKRNERMWNTLSLTEKEAIKKMKKELEKKWQESGRYRDSTRVRAANPGNAGNAGRGAGGTPPPIPPGPTPPRPPTPSPGLPPANP